MEFIVDAKGLKIEKKISILIQQAEAGKRI
jgi:hypothetical protein